jgi:hypothetical protein
MKKKIKLKIGCKTLIAGVVLSVSLLCVGPFNTVANATGSATLNKYWAYTGISSIGFPDSSVNNTYSFQSVTQNGAYNAAYANLTTGQIGILEAGNVDGTNWAWGQAIAELGDTITASGATGGLNLGVNLTVNGTTSLDDPSWNATYLWVAAFKPGTFDTSWYYDPNAGNLLWAEGYYLGSGTSDLGTTIMNANYVSLVDSYTGIDGIVSATIPLNIPFDQLGNNFQIAILMASATNVPNGAIGSWSSDFSHTLGVSLSSPAGVTLYSESGRLPGTQGVPEPATLLLLGLGIAGVYPLKRKMAK